MSSGSRRTTSPKSRKRSGVEPRGFIPFLSFALQNAEKPGFETMIYRGSDPLRTHFVTRTIKTRSGEAFYPVLSSNSDPGKIHGVEAVHNRGAGAAQFRTTSWTIVLACAEEDGSVQAQQALASLFQTYWYPLYAYVRRRGYGEHDAEDVVQAFCLHLQQKHALAKADPHRGKFRSFLLSSLQNFLANEHKRAHAQKRGGEQELVRLDAEEAHARYRLEPAHSVTPEAIFERRWAHALLEQTVSSVREDFILRGKERLFDGLSSFLTSDLRETSYQSAAEQLNLPLSAIKTIVHRMRRDYRARLREEIGRTVASPEEVDEELLYLRKVLASVA